MKRSPMKSSNQSTIFVVATSLAICTFVVFSYSASQRGTEIDDNPEDKGGTRDEEKGSAVFSSLRSSASSSDEGPNKRNCKPMFEYDNQHLTDIVLDMAANRAKRWMSFRVTGCSKMIGQVGGKSHQKRPLLTLEPNFVLKPVNMDHRGIREVAFYEAIQASSSKSQRETYCRLFGPRDLEPLSSKDLFSSWRGRFRKTPEDHACCDESRLENEIKLLHRLELFVPEYFGMAEYIPDESKQAEDVDVCPFGTNYNSHLVFHNLTVAFSKACVLDLKIGTETFEVDAPQSKKDRERAKYPAQKDFGFRLVAMRIYDAHRPEEKTDGYVYYPKEYGRSLETRESVKYALLNFFGGESFMPKETRTIRANAIKKTLTQLKLIKKWFKDNDSFSFSASSILLVYEGDTESTEAQGVQPDLATAKMIDFGRVRRRKGGDPGYLQGVRNLISILEEILRESFWTQEYSYIR